MLGSFAGAKGSLRTSRAGSLETGCTPRLRSTSAAAATSASAIGTSAPPRFFEAGRSEEVVGAITYLRSRTASSSRPIAAGLRLAAVSGSGGNSLGASSSTSIGSGCALASKSGSVLAFRAGSRTPPTVPISSARTGGAMSAARPEMSIVGAPKSALLSAGAERLTKKSSTFGFLAPPSTCESALNVGVRPELGGPSSAPGGSLSASLAGSSSMKSSALYRDSSFLALGGAPSMSHSPGSKI